jgi:hypothetical protein
VPSPGIPRIIRAHYNFETPRPSCSVIWERFERISKLLLCRFVVALLSLPLSVLRCVLVCVLSPSLTQILIVLILCKAWETPTCEDSSQTGWDIRKNTVALKFELWITWEGLSATLDQRRSPQHGVGFSWTMGKIIVSLVYFTLLQFMSSLVLKLHLYIAPSLIHISREQWSEESIFLSFSHPNLVLVYSNTFYRPSLYCLKHFL